MKTLSSRLPRLAALAALVVALLPTDSWAAASTAACGGGVCRPVRPVTPPMGNGSVGVRNMPRLMPGPARPGYPRNMRQAFPPGYGSGQARMWNGGRGLPSAGVGVRPLTPQPAPASSVTPAVAPVRPKAVPYLLQQRARTGVAVPPVVPAR